MASNKGLVEAHAFNRRRLLVAFVSGGPGGRDVQPARHLRLIMASAVLAALVVGGAEGAAIYTDRYAGADALDPGGWHVSQTGRQRVLVEAADASSRRPAATG